MTPTAELRRDLRAALARVLDDSGTDAAHDLAHADRVWGHARAIAVGEGHAASGALMAAAYLHDLMALPKDRPDRARASSLSATAAGPIMEALGFAARDIAVARHAIEAHSFSAGIEPLLPEAVFLRDADRIEALGAIGIARCFAVSGALGRALFDGADPFARERVADDQRWALDHFKVKLLALPDQMLTATARRIASDRATTMRRYLADLAGELNQPTPDW